MANIKCKECGCVCPKCTLDHDVHLHVEIENLKQQLLEKHNHIVTMETNFLNEANKYPNGELLALHDELLTWQDKYKRLYDAHRRIQRVNQGLEDKLLRLVDISETDKNTLTKDVATLSYKLAEANYTIKKLTEDNERYKNDVSVAIQFLQCKPGNFVSQKFDTLPNEVQAKVSTYMGGKRKTDEKKTPPEIKSIKVPIPTFPPTAMVYSVPKSQSPPRTREEKEPEPSVDIVSAAIMAKVLEERARERSCVKHCDTCTCSNQLKIIHNTSQHSIATQTTSTLTATQNDSLCLQCNNKVTERSTLQIVKGVSSVDAGKNKAIPVYIHDYEANANANLAVNVAKVQPNNFLNDNLMSTECSKLRKPVTSSNKLGSVRVVPVTPTVVPTATVNTVAVTETDDLIDLGTPSTGGNNGGEIIYFANERSHKKSHKVKTHDKTKLTHTFAATRLQPQSKANYESLLLKSCSDDFRSILVPTADVSVVSAPVVPVPVASLERKPSSLSSGDHSEFTNSELTNSATNYQNQRIEEWMDSINLTETAAVGSNCGTDCSESLVSSQDASFSVGKKLNVSSEELSIQKDEIEKGGFKTDIDTTKYKEMEDHVKKFLLGECTLLSDVKKNDYD
ncbi:uncharacterized protein [Atheta coriaria]|uniref:uncharacterized protein n=1 Tax=Dalotia coriaria TaxID=877792 RepID=UPI0031F3D984